MRKVLLLLEMGKPRVLLLMAMLALAGAALSPHFLSPSFPETRLSRTALFTWLAERVPGAFTPPLWSLAHALGAALVVGLLWIGTALINDLSDLGLDTVSDPARPLPSRRISQGEALRWALGAQGVALLLIAVEGSLPALLLAMVGAALGHAYSVPPMRLRRSGVMANGIIGVGVAMALTGGMLAQGPATEVGMMTAGALGLLAAAASMVKDFKDLEGDRAAGVRTLPVLIGVRRATWVNIGAVVPAYLILLLLLAHRVGIQPRILGALAGLAGLNLALLAGLLLNPSPAYARSAYRRAILIFMGVTLLYVGAQRLA